MTRRLLVALLVVAASGCTVFRVEGPAFSGYTTVQACPSPVPVTGVRPSGVVAPQ